MFTLEQVLEQLKAIPESRYTAYHYEECVKRWSKWVTSNDPNKLSMMQTHERECQRSCEFYLAQFLGLQLANQAEPYNRVACLWNLARLLTVREYIHRFKFYAALVSPDFGKLTNGHKVSPNSYHVYRKNPTSPTGVCLETSGPRTAEYTALIQAAGRQAGTSNSFA